MKKLVSLLLALVMTLGVCTNVWAEGEDNGQSTQAEQNQQESNNNSHDAMQYPAFTSAALSDAEKQFVSANFYMVNAQDDNGNSVQFIVLKGSDADEGYNNGVGRYKNNQSKENARTIIDRYNASENAAIRSAIENIQVNTPAKGTMTIQALIERYTAMLSVEVENPDGEQSSGLPTGTKPLFFKGTDKNGIDHYYNGTGMRQGKSTTFETVFSDKDGKNQIKGFSVDGSAMPAGLSATVANDALTVTAANNCTPGEYYVVVKVSDASYSLRIIVNQNSGSNPDGPPAFVRDAQKFVEDYFEQTEAGWKVKESSNTNDIQRAWNGLNAEAQRCAVQSYRWLLPMFKVLNISAPGYYLLSANTAVRIKVPSHLQDVVTLQWSEETNTLTVKFVNGLTADRWKAVYEGGWKRDFSMLEYTFLYIGDGQQPNYWTWVDGSDKKIEEVIAEAQSKTKYTPDDRGIDNAICVARFQNDGTDGGMLALPGNTSYNSTSREIISWEGKRCDYFTDVIDTTGMSGVSFNLGGTSYADYGNGTNWLTRVGGTAEPVDDSRITTYTTAGGVSFNCNSGLVKTQFDNDKLLKLQDVLDSYVTITAPDGAKSYRVVSNSTSTEPGAADDAGAAMEVRDMTEWLAGAEWKTVSGPIKVRPNTLKEQTVGDVSYYISDTITGVNCRVFEWKFENGTTKVEYVYFNASPYLHTVQTNSVSAVTREVDKPTLIRNDDMTLTLKCHMFPQDNKNASYMRLTVEQNGQPVSDFSGEYIVYIPYKYVGLTWAEAQRIKEAPKIYHYTSAETLKETLTGEYTQWGICFKTSSFSPFVISTAAQSSSGGGYYYGGASTPGISAVKTADAAKSATDYTSGIYGLTFRSTAAFSGFKGVQVDGRTIAAANYVAEDNGGIEVYLKAVYLRTLKDGRHTVTILSDAGNVTMNFTIGGVDSPTTFDAGIGAYVGMALASVGGMAWMRRRKR